MNFQKLMLPVKKESVFSLNEQGYIVWCGTMAKGDDGLYYLYFSFWPKSKGYDAWLTHSMIGYATSKEPLGPFVYGGIALSGAGGKEWDRDCVHNPSVLKINGKYYLYYMGNYGDGTYWNHRNNQRIGVAWSDNPRGPFKRLDYPVIDVTPGSFDSLMVSNPSVTKGDDGRYYMIYKGVSAEGTLPQGGPVVCGMAKADDPLGPFVKTNKPIMVNPEKRCSVEDPYIWCQNGKFYALVKDFYGYFTDCNECSVALFESTDGLENWKPAENPLAFRMDIQWEDGTVQKLLKKERPQIYVDETGKPKVLMCACCDIKDKSKEETFNVQIPLK